jgi:TolB-like protein/class 3 adenylate cyclase/Tfp pilus assembly protein PilF
MTTQRVKRKLSAILSADVKGYSRLMSQDEEATVKTLKQHRETVSGLILDHRGRVVDAPGDNVLAEFGSVVDAVKCAVQIQQALKTKNAGLPEDRRMNFRIGVNLGDVIEEEDRIYGDGVNIAARLEGLAEGGGIYISGTAFDHVKNKLSVGYQYVGKQTVKNIPDPVRAYKVLMEPEAVGKVIGEEEPKPTKWGWKTVAAGVLALVVLAGGLVWNFYLRAPRIETASVEKMAYPLPDKPSIAVLPFVNLSEDPKQEYFTDGMTDDLITDLSKISGLLVIARNSVFLYKDKPVRVQQMAQELGVRYVLEGSMRRAGDRVRINAQLIDATTGGHVWAERYDESLVDVFALQDKVTRRIVAALKVKLTPQEQAVAAGRDTRNVAAYDAFLTGWAHLLRKTPEDAVEAIAFFEQALELDPNYTRAYAALAQTYWDYSNDKKFNAIVDPWLGASFPRSGHMTYVNAWKFLQKGRSKPSSQAHTLTARMLQRQRRFDEAMEEAKQAVALGPNNPTAYDALIENLIYAGEAEEALRLIDESIRLDPNLPGEKLFLKGMAYYTLGRLEEAVSIIDRARSHNPKQTRYAAIQAAALAELGRTAEAGVALEQAERYVGTTYADLNWAMFYWPFQRLETIERLANSFIKAGLATPLKRYYAVAEQDRLTGDQIKSLLSNKVMIGADRSYFAVGEDEFEVTRGQNAQVVSQRYLNYFRKGGKTRVENDLLCDAWLDLGDYCVAIYRNPDGNPDARDEYLFFTLMSTFSFSVFDSAS